jgi:hypothetical protein
MVRAIVAAVVLCGCAVTAPSTPSRPFLTGPVVRRGAPAPVARAEGPSQPPRLDVRCGEPASCPEAIGMLVAPGRELPERCTAVLVGPTRVLTASHCVTPVLGEAATCEGTWVAFPVAGDHGMTWRRCARVVEASMLPDDGVLRRDVAVLELDEAVARLPLALAPEPPTEGRVVPVASVTPHRIYATQHEVAVRLCRVGWVADAEPHVGPDAARVGWLRDCPIYPGNSGAAVLDAEGRLAAIVHGGSHPFFGVGVTTPVTSVLETD